MADKTPFDRLQELLEADAEAAAAFEALGNPADLDDVIALAKTYGIEISEADFPAIAIDDDLYEELFGDDEDEEDDDDDDFDDFLDEVIDALAEGGMEISGANVRITAVDEDGEEDLDDDDLDGVSGGGSTARSPLFPYA